MVWVLAAYLNIEKEIIHTNIICYKMKEKIMVIQYLFKLYKENKDSYLEIQ